MAADTRGGHGVGASHSRTVLHPTDGLPARRVAPTPLTAVGRFPFLAHSQRGPVLHRVTDGRRGRGGKGAVGLWAVFMACGAGTFHAVGFHDLFAFAEDLA